MLMECFRDKFSSGVISFVAKSSKDIHVVPVSSMLCVQPGCYVHKVKT